MNCPMCLKSMQMEQIRDASFYVCRDCRGLWVQMGQLAKLAQTIDPGDFRVTPKSSNRNSNRADVDVSVNCPHCMQMMTNHEYAFNSGIMIDRCDACGGIWLDAEKIVQIKRHLKDSVPKPGEGAGLLGKPWEDGLLKSDVNQMGAGFVLEGLGELIVGLLLGLFD